MACFQLIDMFGNTRWVSQLEPYRKVNGEKIVDGAIDWDCGKGPKGTQKDLVAQMLHDLDAELGKQGLGEWVKYFAAPIAKQLGKENCLGCDVRRVLGDAVGPLVKKYGVINAASIVAGLIKDSFTKPELDILIELKEYLDRAV